MLLVGVAALVTMALAAAPHAPSDHAPSDAPPDDAATYEDAQLADVMRAQGFTPHAPRKNERIAFITIVRHEVFTPDDPWPDFLNIAHIVTAEDVVARELLFAPGAPFDARLQESARNLRSMGIFSLVRIASVSRADGAVGVLVFVRDLWSLRFEQGFQVTGANIDRLQLQLTERNVAGRAKSASVRFALEPGTWSLGETYSDRRVWGGPLTAAESFDVLFATDHLGLDGSRGAVLFGAPLTSLQQPWGFAVTGSYEVRVVRQLQQGVLLTYDDPRTVDLETVPRTWNQRDVDAEASLRRQFTRVLVHRFSAGVGITDTQVELTLPHDVSARAGADFTRDVTPTVRRTLYPFVEYLAFANRERVYEDLDTFGQSEAVRLGPAFSASIGAGNTAAFSSSDTVFLGGGAGFALDPFASLVDVGLDVRARVEDGAVINRQLGARMRLASPPALFGRVLFRADATFRRDDVTNTLVTLGGDNGLRGYPSQAFFATGASIAQATLEYRTLPLEWASVHVGGALFYDVGSVFTEPNEAVPHHDVGIGLRVLFPQFNRSVYRIDFAVPVDEVAAKGLGGFRVQFSFGDTQAVEHAKPTFERLAQR
jgi:hypothetical protein